MMNVKSFIIKVKHTHLMILIATAIFLVSFFLPVISIIPGFGVSGFTAAKSSFKVMFNGPKSILGEFADFTDMGINNNDSNDHDTIDNQIWVETAWLLNIGFLIVAILMILSNKNNKHSYFSIIAALCLLWAMFGMVKFIGDDWWNNFLTEDYDKISIGFENSYSIGYYAWYLSFAFLTIGGFLNTRQLPVE